MQERTTPVFVAATSNDISLLSTELTRQGRFDEVFFVDLPNALEREHLFALQLARRDRNRAVFDRAGLAAITNVFSGSEIEQAVVNALYAAFPQQCDIDTAMILDEVRRTRPLSIVAPDRVTSIRDWGALHARAV